jgi:hypothetical protein
MDLYKRVIEILMNEEIDYKRVVVELAKCEPEVFLRVVDRAPVPWMEKAVEDIKNGMLIEAIKDARNQADLPLKEAKDLMEKVAFAIYCKYGPGALAADYNAIELLKSGKRVIILPTISAKLYQKFMDII